MYVPWTTFLRLLICLNENEKRQWSLIYLVCKYSEEDCSSRGELTDVIKYAALCRITGLASFRPWEFTLPSRTHEVRTTEDASPKFAYLVFAKLLVLRLSAWLQDGASIHSMPSLSCVSVSSTCTVCTLCGVALVSCRLSANLRSSSPIQHQMLYGSWLPGKLSCSLLPLSILF